MKKRRAESRDRKQTQAPRQPKRTPWEPPALRRVGTIAEIVQQPKVSGGVDGAGNKRH